MLSDTFHFISDIIQNEVVKSQSTEWQMPGLDIVIVCPMREEEECGDGAVWTLDTGHHAALAIGKWIIGACQGNLPHKYLKLSVKLLKPFYLF